MIAVRTFYQNVWNQLGKIGLQATTIVPNYDFSGAIKFENQNNKDIINVNIHPHNPLKLVSWPRRLHASKEMSMKGGLDIFLAVRQSIVKNNNGGVYRFAIHESYIHIFYCKSQQGISGYDMEGYKPDLHTCIRYDFNADDQENHPMHHMQFDKGSDLLDRGGQMQAWCNNVIPQIRIPTPPKDILGVLWGLFADHYPAKMLDYKNKIERGLSNSRKNIPQMTTQLIRDRINNDPDKQIRTGHWYPEWDI